VSRTSFGAVGEPMKSAIYKSKMCKQEATERSKEIGAARDWLQANREWLLIIDNVAPKDAMQYLPGGRAHILFTSRNPDWTDFTQLVGLMEWKSEESFELLLKCTGSIDRSGAEKRAVQLGRLPLALAQARAYIEQTRKSIAAYSSPLGDRTSRILETWTANHTEVAQIVDTADASITPSRLFQRRR